MFGIKPSKIAPTMIKQLQQCWEATHPEKPPTKAKGKAKAAAPRKKKLAVQSESSEEEPLALQPAGKKKRAPTKTDKPDALTVDQLNAEFEKIMLEPDNYIKVLRYEVWITGLVRAWLLILR